MYIVALKNNKTGEVREITFNQEWNDFAWMEGSYSCDCNRQLFFARAKAEEENWEAPCGETQFSIEFVKIFPEKA